MQCLQPTNARFLQHDAMWCLSVHLSVTFVDSVKMNKYIIKIFSPSSSHIILVFQYQLQGNIPIGTP